MAASFVAENCTAQSNSGNTASTTTTRTIAATEHVVVTIKSKAAAGAVTAVTVGGLSLTKDAGSVGGTMASETWSKPAGSSIGSGATVTVTWTNSGANTMAFVCMSLSGIPTSGYVRGSGTNTGTSQNPNATATASAEILQPGDWVVTTYGVNATIGATPPSGEAQQTELSSSGTTMETGQGRLGFAANATAPTWTAGGNVASWQATIVVYEAGQAVTQVAASIFAGQSKTTGTTVALTGTTLTLAVGDSVLVTFSTDATTGTPTFAKTGGTCVLGSSSVLLSGSINGAGTVYIIRADCTTAGTLTGITVTHTSVAARAGLGQVFRGLPATFTNAQQNVVGSTSTFLLGGFNTGTPAGAFLFAASGYEGPTSEVTGNWTRSTTELDLPDSATNLIGTTGGGATSNMSNFSGWVLTQSTTLTASADWRQTSSSARNNGDIAIWFASGAALTQDVNDTASVADSATAARGLGALPADTATVADAQAFGVGEGIDDTASVADVQTTAAGFNTTIPDTATVADSASGSLGKSANPADTATVADATTQAIGKEASIPDTATVADAQTFGFGPGVVDTAAVADAQTPAAGFSTTVPDTATVADAQTPAAGFSTTVPDTATVADAQSFQQGKEAVIPDTATVADAQTASAGFNKPVADTATVADAQAFDYGKGVTDTAAVADATSQQSGKETTVPDTLSVADAQAFGYGEGVTDTATVADAQSFQSSGGTTITDAIGVADSVSTSAGFAISTTDPAAVADALRFDLSKSLADALSVADALTTSQGWAAQVADTLIVADAASTASGIQAALADNVSVADATAIARGISTALADTANVADAQTFQRAIESAIADAIGLADAISFSQDRAIVIPDILVVADARALGISQHLDDAIDVDDAVALLGSGASAAYIHHVPPLRGDIEPNDSNGLVVAIVADGVISIYSSSGLVLELDDEGVNV